MRKLSDILKEWDANRSQRQNLLTEFLTMTEDKTAIDLANALGHHTSLLFARFIAALRLNYNNQGVGLLLEAINRFTGATGGLEYVDELIESGTLLTLIEMLSLENPTEADKNASIRVVYSISLYGLKYKEIICKVGSIRVICECLAKAKMADLKQNCFFLLDSLVKGNPRYTASIYRALIALLPADSSTAVQVSLQILRKIQPSVDPIKELISPLLGTLGSYHGEVRYEAKLFIIALADNQIISHQLLHGLVKSLDLNVETQNLSDYIRQSAAVESLDELIRMKPSEWIENKLIQHGVLSKLIHTLANTKHPESQRNAAVALMTLSKKIPDKTSTIKEALGPLATDWSKNPENVHEKIDSVSADALVHHNLDC